jgi:hypothetical protein
LHILNIVLAMFRQHGPDGQDVILAHLRYLDGRLSWLVSGLVGAPS